MTAARARSAHTEPSWPGLSRPSRLSGHRALPIEIAGSSPAMTSVGMSISSTRSFDRDLGRCHLDIALVIGPFELELSALGCRREKADEGVRGNGGVQVGAEDLLAIIGAHERIDDVARHHGADFVAAIA